MSEYIFKDWNAAKIIEYMIQPELTAVSSRKLEETMEDYAIMLSGRMFRIYERGLI